MKLRLRRKSKADAVPPSVPGLSAPPVAPVAYDHTAMDKVWNEYPDGQSYASHAFRPTEGYPLCCHYCGMGEIDPNHADYRAGHTVARDPATGRWAKREGRM